jgi:hypothetical protein
MKRYTVFNPEDFSGENIVLRVKLYTFGQRNKLNSKKDSGQAGMTVWGYLIAEVRSVISRHERQRVPVSRGCFFYYGGILFA